jgi:hypothetical protein
MSRQLHRTKRYLSQEEWLKRVEDDKEWERQQFEKEELKKYGVVTYSRQSTEYEPDVTVIPVEIEVPSEIDAFTKNEILDEYGRDYKSWIQQCYLHRMGEILTNPEEFGKIVLEEKKRDHCIQNADLVDY